MNESVTLEVDSKKSTDHVDTLAQAFSESLQVIDQRRDVIAEQHSTIICDMGYGLPKEVRPRREKLLAISRQLVNFLQWQQQNQSTGQCCTIQVVECNDPDLLENRMLQLWKQECQQDALPDNFSIATGSLEDWLQQNHASTLGKETAQRSPAIYLSPDASNILDPSLDPPPVLIVGLLIDRRVQVNRSRDRAAKLTIPTARWNLECVSDVLDPNEPLNVDCVLEGMQQWYWNCAVGTSRCSDPRRYQDAVIAALQHHQERHPKRPQHKVKER